MKLFRNILGRFGFVHRKDLRGAHYREYAAAAINRLTADWVSSVRSVDQDIKNGLVTIRERARDMAKNNDLARRFLNLCRVNIVGPNGFKLQMGVSERIEVKEGDKTTFKTVHDAVANMKIEEAWEDWTRAEHCHVAGRLSFRGICEQLVTYEKRDGEAFLRMVPRKSSKYGMQLQVIPPEAIDEKRNERLQNGNVVKMGIEMDSWRRPVAYWVKKINPELELYGVQQYANEYERIPAWQVIQYFYQEYENQTRGISRMVQTMVRMKMLQGYEESAAVNARVSAGKMGFFTQLAESSETYEGDSRDTEGNIISSVEPGGFEQLPAGMDFKPWSPEYPHAQHEMFLKNTNKLASAGLNVAYASLTNDLAEANYGSNRVGLLDERSMWKLEQEAFKEVVLNRVFSEWLLAALGKAIALPVEKYDKFNKPFFVGRRWDWIDPLKDMAAIALGLKLMITSHYQVIGEMGEDPEALLTDIKSFKELVEKYGLTYNIDSVGLSMPKDAQDKKTPGTEEDRAVFDFVTRILSAAEHTNGNGKHKGE